MTETIQKILNAYNEGNLVYIDREGQHIVSMNDFTQAGSDSVLQKVNRTDKILLSLAEKKPDSLKWVNDYALAQVTKALYDVIDGLKGESMIQQTAIEKLNLQIDELKQSTAQVELDNTSELQSKLDEAYAQINELTVKIDNLKDDNAGLTQQADMLKNKLYEIENSSENNEAATAELQKEFDAYKLEKKQEVDELNIKIQKITDRAKKVIDEKTETIEEYKKALDDNAIEFQRLTSLATNSEVSKQKIADLEDAVSNLNEDRDKLNEELEFTTNQLDSLTKTHNATLTELNEAKESAQSLTGRLQMVESDLSDADKKYAKLSEAYDEVNEQLKAASKERDEYHLAYDKSREQSENMSVELGEQNEYRQKVQTLFDDIKKAINESGVVKIVDTQSTGYYKDIRGVNAVPRDAQRVGAEHTVNFNLGM